MDKRQQLGNFQCAFHFGPFQRIAPLFNFKPFQRVGVAMSLRPNLRIHLYLAHGLYLAEQHQTKS